MSFTSLRFYILCLITCLCTPLQHAFVFSQENNLLNDLMIVSYWNQRLNDRMPVTYNHLLQGGYFSMPSARMGIEGEVGIGYAYIPPYRNYNLRCQLLDFLEVSGNYRVFKGVDDPILTPLGFGDLSDKGANLKLSIFRAEDTNYSLPGIAIGIEDFLGTKNFHSKYIVATKVFIDYNLEVSLGYGTSRIRGFFGGFNWMPFRQSCWKYLQNLSLCAEYDATPYKDETIEKHPKGRVKKSPINFGIKYRLWDQIDASLSYVRGTTLAASVSMYYNFGLTKGLLPKIDDTLPYSAPVNKEPIGCLRPEDAVVQDFLYAMEDQGFDLYKVWLYYDEYCQKTLHLSVENYSYRLECDVRTRIDHLLAYLTPSDIDRVIVTIEYDGLPIQEYRYEMQYLNAFAAKDLGPCELHVLTPLKEASYPPCHLKANLLDRNRELFNFEIMPKVHTLFGSSRGKFKYALGIGTVLTGFLFDDLFYSVRLGWVFFTDMSNVSDKDRLNPSQLPNVRTDVVNYYKNKGITLDEAYIQKNWNFGKGWFARASLGYFEEEYAGFAAETLYYPVQSRWALGAEAAIFRKRTYSGLGFTDEVRQLHGFEPTFHKFTFYQYFLNFHYEWCEANADFKISVGKFLANDYGTRFEIARWFPSGLKISIWYTITNGHDKINGHIYHDKGIAFSMPLDIFYTHSERSRFGYGLSAWLRDVGASAATGQSLYNIIREQRLE